MKLDEYKNDVFWFVALIAVVLVPLAILLAGCQNTTVEEPVPGGNGGGGKPALDYSWVQANIIGPNCISCHSNANAVAGVVLETYGDLQSRLVAGRPDESQLCISLRGGSGTIAPMPPGGSLPDSLTERFCKWIRDGAIESASLELFSYSLDTEWLSVALRVNKSSKKKLPLARAARLSKWKNPHIKSPSTLPASHFLKSSGTAKTNAGAKSKKARVP